MIQFFDSIAHHQSNWPQTNHVNIIGDECGGYCMDAPQYVPAGSTQRFESFANNPAFATPARLHRDY